MIRQVLCAVVAAVMAALASPAAAQGDFVVHYRGLLAGWANQSNGYVDFYRSEHGYYARLAASASLPGNITWRLPVGYSAGACIKDDGAGNLYVGSCGIGDLVAGNNLSELTATASTARANIGAQAAHANLTALAGLTYAADKCTYWTSSTAAATFTCSSYGRSLIGSTDAAAARSALGLGSLATLSVAPTATALAANGTNCSAGSYPLGTDASGNAESCTAAASTVNLSLDVGVNRCPDAGSTDTYACSLVGGAPAAYSTSGNGVEILLVPNTSNTATASVNVNSLGAKTITRLDGSTLETGDLIAGAPARLWYDGTNFRLISQSGATRPFVYGAGGGVSVLSSGAGTKPIFTIPAVSVTGADNVIIGGLGTNGVTTGSSLTSAARSVFIGNGVGSGGPHFGGDNVLIGYGTALSYTGSANAVVVGSAAGGRDNSVSIGYGAYVGNSHGVAVGYTASVAGNGIALGNSATSVVGSISISMGLATTAASQLVVGPITDAYFGNGVASASPSSATINGTGGSGTNIAGASIATAGGKATGTGVPGDVIQQTSVPGTTGTALQTLGDRFRVLGKYTALAEATATSFARVAIASGTATGGLVIVTVEAGDGTEEQSRTLTYTWSAANKAGVLYSNFSTPVEAIGPSFGTLTCTITLVDAGSGNLDHKADCTSSLTQTVLRASAQVFKNLGVGAISAQ